MTAVTSTKHSNRALPCNNGIHSFLMDRKEYIDSYEENRFDINDSLLRGCTLNVCRDRPNGVMSRPLVNGSSPDIPQHPHSLVIGNQGNPAIPANFFTHPSCALVGLDHPASFSSETASPFTRRDINPQSVRQQPGFVGDSSAPFFDEHNSTIAKLESTGILKQRSQTAHDHQSQLQQQFSSGAKAVKLSAANNTVTSAMRMFIETREDFKQQNTLHQNLCAVGVGRVGGGLGSGHRDIEAAHACLLLGGGEPFGDLSILRSSTATGPVASFPPTRQSKAHINRPMVPRKLLLAPFYDAPPPSKIALPERPLLPFVGRLWLSRKSPEGETVASILRDRNTSTGTNNQNRHNFSHSHIKNYGTAIEAETIPRSVRPSNDSEYKSPDEQRSNQVRAANAKPFSSHGPKGEVLVLEIPCRPLSAYNFFFSEERERILEILASKTTCSENGVQMSGDEIKAELKKSCAASRSALSAPSDIANRMLMMQKLPNNKLKKRRPHRKSHGRIGFKSLAMLIAQRWRDMSGNRLAHYKQLALMDLKRYKTEMSDYNTKRKCHESIIKSGNDANIN